MAWFIMAYSISHATTACLQSIGDAVPVIFPHELTLRLMR